MSCRVVYHCIPAYCAVPSKLASTQLKRFGANLRRERVKAGVTQEELAEMADLNVRTLQKMEAGQTNILITTAIRLRHSLGCPWSALLP